MIKINLLPQRRARKRGAGAEPSARQLMAGVLGLAVAAAAVALLVDQPRRARLAQLTRDNKQLQAQIQSKLKQLEGYDQLKQEAGDADERARSIKRLIRARVVPANVLHELGEILTPNRRPKMTADMKQRVATDPNRRFAADWDASHVWLSGFSDTGGAFKLEGGAQSESDITQLAKRLAASVYFTDVTPVGGERVADSQTGANYYKFTITGKVAY